MVSVQDLYEAKQALKGGADIVDVKNLQEALVGSAHPKTVKQIREEVPSIHHASVTLGVVPNQVGTVRWPCTRQVLWPRRRSRSDSWLATTT